MLGSLLRALVGRRSFRQLWATAYCRSALAGMRALEIGGPSPMLGLAGQLPVYDVLSSLDNCLYSRSTIWTGDVQKGNTFVYLPGKEPGMQVIAEASDLRAIPDASYDCVIACHCLEHIANPFAALGEWKRILKWGGLLLLILPHKEGTFDWRRPITPLQHMIDDFEQQIFEDDLTHLPEILRLHDLSKDPGAGTGEQFRKRSLKNYIYRALHHHVFDTITAVMTVDYAGFQVLQVDPIKPCHIIILAQRTLESRENAPFMDRRAGFFRRSPFQLDRKLPSRPSLC